ncbi:MAG TPA: transcriptional activator RfaH [Candidatus Cybelea sp.]|nr:transcriptional activator RfaH [Candidatus Cybelea sp.]
MIRWFVVQTQANAEARACRHLNEQGFATYLPRYLKQRRHARRTERVARPLFPRYLFVAFDPQAARWRAVHSTVGVSRLVGRGEVPTPVPDAVVAALRAREDAEGFFPVDQRIRFAVGEAVRIVSGAFADAVGRFQSMDDDARVVVLLDLLGRQVKATVSMDAVTAGT